MHHIISAICCYIPHRNVTLAAAASSGTVVTTSCPINLRSTPPRTQWSIVSNFLMFSSCLCRAARSGRPVALPASISNRASTTSAVVPLQRFSRQRRYSSSSSSKPSSPPDGPRSIAQQNPTSSSRTKTDNEKRSVTRPSRRKGRGSTGDVSADEALMKLPSVPSTTHLHPSGAYRAHSLTSHTWVLTQLQMWPFLLSFHSTAPSLLRLPFQLSVLTAPSTRSLTHAANLPSSHLKSYPPFHPPSTASKPHTNRVKLTNIVQNMTFNTSRKGLQ